MRNRRKEIQMEQTYVTLNNGAQIPQFGLGVYHDRGRRRYEAGVLWML
jgi:diketogulonate reductase-like aldo/keto reductase